MIIKNQEDVTTAVLEAGAARVVSTDSIPHVSNAISIVSLLAAASVPLMSPVPSGSTA